DRERRRLQGRRSGRQNRVIEVQRLLAAAGLFYLQSVRIDDRGEALDVLHLAMLDELAGPAGQALDDIVLERAELREVDPRLAELDAPRLRASRLVQHVGDVQERLRGNAAAIDADAARVHFGIDKRHAQAEIGGEKRGGVAAGSASDDRKLDRIHGTQTPPRTHESTKSLGDRLET